MFMCGKGNFKRLSAGSLATIAGTSLEEAKPQQRLPSQWVAATIAICLMVDILNLTSTIDRG